MKHRYEGYIFFNFYLKSLLVQPRYAGYSGYSYVAFSVTDDMQNVEKTLGSDLYGLLERAASDVVGRDKGHI